MYGGLAAFAVSRHLSCVSQLLTGHKTPTYLLLSLLLHKCFLSYSVQFYSLKTVTLLARAGLYRSFHNPPNSDVGLCDLFVCVYTLGDLSLQSHPKDFSRVCTELDSGGNFRVRAKPSM